MMAPSGSFFERVRAFAAEAAANKGEINRVREMDKDDKNALHIYDEACGQLLKEVNRSRSVKASLVEMGTESYARRLDAIIQSYKSLALDGWHSSQGRKVRRFDDIGGMKLIQMKLAEKLVGYCGGILEPPQASALVMKNDNYEALMAKQGKATKAHMF